MVLIATDGKRQPLFGQWKTVSPKNGTKEPLQGKGILHNKPDITAYTYPLRFQIPQQGYIL